MTPLLLKLDNVTQKLIKTQRGNMPQVHFPIFPAGCSKINNELAFQKENGKVTYFNWNMPVFSHDENDINTFRMITSQFCENGNAKQIEIAKAFGVTPISVKRAVKKYRKEGPKGFYAKRRTRGASVLTPEVMCKIQQAFDKGASTAEVADEFNIKTNTLSKAIHAGRLHYEKKEIKPDQKSLKPTTKSDRSKIDNTTEMGVGAYNILDRVAASLGKGGPPKRAFLVSLDIPNGGVLFALPALLANGLLRKTSDFFRLPPGYYHLESIFLLIAFMALSRIKFIEDIRYCPPGEWGKLLGLDRIPEVSVLRKKVKQLSNDDQPTLWSAELCSDWMEAEVIEDAIFYIDSHVRVYHGSKTKLPKHHVSRQKLCLRATVDYWVNAMDGQPFFFINKEIDPGLIKVLQEEIVPRLQKEVPNQPTELELEDDPYLHCFKLVFDREGYSPDFLLKMKKIRIACITYHKYPKEDWPLSEFSTYKNRLPNGEEEVTQLAERGTFLSNKLWVREIRKLTKSGHQTSVIATDYQSDLKPIALSMFARWTQENFFKYMRNHFNIDRLVDYNTESIPDTTKVVNPRHRELEGKIRSKAGILNRKLAAFGAMNMTKNIEEEHMEQFEREKSELQEEINHLKREIDSLKYIRKRVKKHIQISELPEEEMFTRLSVQSKHLLDSIKMIAYRAETAMSNIIREEMPHGDVSRRLLQTVYKTEANLLPDDENNTLTVQLHHLGSHHDDKIIQLLCDELNLTETIYPGTSYKLNYELVTKKNP
ncbi:MAG: hypothetical protein GY739_17415 [Mesoflavibacter sp.]|nr:hypothetical protein [Mesoflavibacter sp.]